MSSKVTTHTRSQAAARRILAYAACLLLAVCGCVQEEGARVADGESRGVEKVETLEPVSERAAVAVDESPTVPRAEPTDEPEATPELHTERLTNAASSEWELAEWVLSALKARDAKALHSLRINETEFREHVFPGSPEAKGTIPVDFQWYYLNVRSFAGVQDAIDDYGGLDLELLDVIPTRGIKEYDGYTMWSYVELMVRFPDGQDRQIQVFGSVVEMDGQFKILAFPT